MGLLLTAQYRRATLVAACIAVAFWALVPERAAAQLVSPGPLSKAHESIDGISKCFECHSAGAEVSDKRCLRCHEPVRDRINRRSGYHGKMDARKRSECGECHREHLGARNKLIDWEGPRESFDHRLTGWPLKGRHQPLRCFDCHQTRRIKARDVIERLKNPTKRTTFLGLPNQCVGCHFDEHRGQEGRICEDCHTEVNFRSAPKFDHNSDSDYALTGRHQKVACFECHPTKVDNKTSPNAFPAPVSKKYLQFLDIPHQGCQACHEDVHNGKFGPACGNCHTTAGWNIMKTAARDTGFHDKHRFPLRGGHIGVECKKCHGPFPGQAAVFRGLPFKNCMDCHFDAHVAQFAKSQGGRRCERCHTVQSYEMPTYELEDHQKTRFKLEGSHAAVPCDRCHTKNPKLADRVPPSVVRTTKQRKRKFLVSLAMFKLPGKGDECEDCHEDIHQGQFATGDAPKGCTDCHNQVTFTALNFDHDRDSRFALEGAHKEVRCVDCHLPETIDGVDGVIRYKPLSTECESCHFDVHAGQFTHAGGEKVPCVTCHTNDSFEDLLFDHNDPKFSDYPLEGEHAGVECGACHPTIEITLKERTLEVVRYTPLPKGCADCHADYHRGDLFDVPEGAP